MTGESSTSTSTSTSTPTSNTPPGDRERATEDRLTPTGVLGRAIARIRADPALLVPFALAGLVLSVLDRLRLWDPVPTLVTRGLGGSTILEFAIYPTGTAATTRRAGALVDLETPYLAWAIGLEVVAVLAVAVAGWYTIVRAAGVAPTTRGLGSYVGFVVLIAAATRLLGSVGDVTLGGLVGLVVFLGLFLLVLFVFARLFVAPALAALEASPPAAIRESLALTSGHERPLAILVLCYGVLAWLLGALPQVGALTSSVLVAAVHAVSTVTVVASVGDGSLADGRGRDRDPDRGRDRDPNRP